jgi:hypothetical protein
MALVCRANEGDESAVPGLRRALAEYPVLAERLVRLALRAEEAVIELVAGSSLAAREAVALHAGRLRDELGEAAASPLEKLLIQRLVVSWIACHAAEAERADRLQRPSPEAGRAAAERWLDRAHARFLAAAKALATVRKLLARPGLSPVELALRPVAEAPPAAVPTRCFAHRKFPVRSPCRPTPSSAGSPP